MATFLASVEVDQRQRLILQADKLREMLGASRLIERTVDEATNLLRGYQDIRLVTAVSGVLRFTASDLRRLGDFLWQLRSAIVERLHLPCTFTLTPAGALFKPSVDRLEERVRENKDARAGSASPPTSPLFAQCLIQPHLSANRWNPPEWRGDDRRRSLVSDESYERESESDESFSKMFLEFDKLKDFRERNKISLWQALPKELSHLAPASSDSYIAFVKADGDGMGRLLMKLNWDKLVPSKDGGSSCLEFSDAIEKCLDKATTDAVDAVTKEWEYSTNSRFPVAPLIRAGEDFWIVCRRNVAIRLTLALGEAYEDLTQRTEIIASSMNAIPELREERLTLSFGILFAKQGFPIEAQLHMVEALVKNAKRFRARYFSANERPKSGCMDYYWLESSAREDVIEYRDSTLRISESDGADFQLYTTPWTLSEAKQFLMAAEQLARSTLASRKLKQLETILRLGYDLSSLAFAQWKRMLQPGEWRLFIDACKLLPDRFPIHEMLLREEPFLPVPGATNEWWTPLLDLTKMVEIQTTDV